jgi:archaeal flagellin FlaB
MLHKWLHRLIKGEKGITGLETAIILIAFVMVASVLSYVVISAGIYSSQKAKENIDQGLQQSSGTVEPKGNVLAKTEDGFLTTLYLTIGKVSRGGAIDFTDTTNDKNVVVISYADSYQQFPSLDWTMTKLATRNDNNLLEDGELFQITIDLAPVNAGATSDDQKLQAYHTFSLEIKPPNGAVLVLERTVPVGVSEMVNLY